MATPDNLSGTDEIESSDLLAVWSSRNRDSRRVSYGQFRDAIADSVENDMIIAVESANASAEIAQTAAETAAGTVAVAVDELRGEIDQTVADALAIPLETAVSAAALAQAASEASSVAAANAAATLANSVKKGEAGQGLVASPLHFGIPLESEGVDYTTQLQLLISQPVFAFPPGFKCSARTLFPKSDTRGDWGDAIIKLMPGMPFLTPQIAFEGSQTNIYYTGGVFNGNRGFNSGTGPTGQDGGLHGCRIYSGSKVKWFSPRFINAGTDGIYVNQTDGEISDFHIYSPVADNCSRQGCSIINVPDIHFYDSSWLNTNGISPQAGIDIEPNLPSENVRAYFHGRTLCQGNAGRGFFIDGKDNNGVYSVFLDDYVARSNGAESFRMTRGGTQNVIARSMDCDGAVSFGPSGSVNFNARRLVAKAVGITTETPSTAHIILRGDDWEVGAYAYTSTSSADCAWDIKGVNAARREISVGKLLARNAGSNVNNSYSGLVYGSAGLYLKIGDYKSVSPRGLILSGNGNQSEINVTADVAMQNTAVNLIADASQWDVRLKKTVADAALALQCAGSDNSISVTWNGANGALAIISGATNKAAFSSRNSTVTLVGLSGASSGNVVSNSFLHRTDAGLLIDKAGTGNVYIGNVPASLNT